MDILAISKDKSELLVIELKKGRASDVVVGQIQRYMGFAQYELAELIKLLKVSSSDWKVTSDFAALSALYPRLSSIVTR